MHSILTFISIGIGLALTLLYDPQWGIMMGLIAYLIGSNTLQARELAQIKAIFQKVMNDLPDMVKDLVEQRLKDMAVIPATPSPLPPPPPVKEEEPADKTSALSDLDQRFSALDSKLSASVELLAAREAAPLVASNPGKVSDDGIKADKTLEQPHKEAIGVPKEAEHATPRASENAKKESPSAQADPAPTIETRQVDMADKEAELAAMREQVERMAAKLTRQEYSGPVKPTDMPPMAAPAKAASSLRPSYDQLRTELDKIALELRRELDRPKS